MWKWLHLHIKAFSLRTLKVIWKELPRTSPKSLDTTVYFDATKDHDQQNIFQKTMFAFTMTITCPKSGTTNWVNINRVIPKIVQIRNITHHQRCPYQNTTIDWTHRSMLSARWPKFGPWRLITSGSQNLLSHYQKNAINERNICCWWNGTEIRNFTQGWVIPCFGGNTDTFRAKTEGLGCSWGLWALKRSTASGLSWYSPRTSEWIF